MIQVQRFRNKYRVYFVFLTKESVEDFQKDVINLAVDIG